MTLRTTEMKTANSVFLFILLIANYLSTSAQTPNFIPPSPTAAAFGKYGDIPVGNYTGVPNISIPLYSVKSGVLELPITLSYHGAGIKVTEEASLVGLGWSLNNSGIITRQVVGIDDFKSANGYVQAPALPPTTQLNRVTLIHTIPDNSTADPIFSFQRSYPEAYDQCERSASGSLDTQPDIFFYNFFGYSGRLVFNKQSGSRIVGTSVDQNNLRFIYDLTTGKWEVTDGNGWAFSFQTGEITRTAGSAAPGPTLSVGADGPQSYDMTSAWYLDKVVAPSGDEITFSYIRSNRWLKSPLYHSQIATRKSDLKINNTPGICFSNTDGYNLFTASETMVDEVYLTTITFNNGRIVFNPYTQDRLDRIKASVAGYTATARYLNSFVVYDKNDNIIKMVEFNHSYFRSDKINASDKENYLRLRLDHIQESFRNASGQFVKSPPHYFTYDETPLPAKNSPAVDHWGYSNGSDNTSIRGYKFLDIPMTGTAADVNQEKTTTQTFYSSQFNNTDNAKVFILGANREPNAAYAQSAILTSIRYPTGGVTKFNYQPNDYWSPPDNTYDETPVAIKVTSSGTNQQTFTLTRTTFVFLEMKLVNNYYQGDPTNTTVMNTMNVVLQKSDGTGILRFIPSDTQMDNTPGGNNNVDNMESYVSVVLPAGTYRIKADHGGQPYLNITLEAKYTNFVQTYKKKAAGLRIESMENYSTLGGTLITKKTFKYEESAKSTGRLMSKNQIFYNETEMMTSFMSDPEYYVPCCYINSIISPRTPPAVHKIVTSSGSVVPLGSSAQGSAIGYNLVTVSTEDELGNALGKSTYNYKSYEETAPAIFMPHLPKRVYLENGQLVFERHYNGAGQLVKETETQYKKDEVTQLHLVGLSTIRIYNDWQFSDGWQYPAALLPVFAGIYDVYAEWWYPEKIIETTYAIDGTNPITQTTNFEYSNAAHKMVTKVSVLNSEKAAEVTTYAYASDSPAGTNMSSTVFNRMITDNILNPVLKEEKRVGSILVDGSINNYGINSLDKVVLNDVQSLKVRENTYEARIKYHQYDSKGRVLQITNPNGSFTSYMWAYNAEYPIVTAENIDYTTLKTAVETVAGTTDLDTYWKSFSTTTFPNVNWNTFNASLRNQVSLKTSQVRTFLYAPLVGVVSESDINGQAIYFEYDDFKRLKFTRDHAGDIVKSYTYHYSSD